MNPNDPNYNAYPKRHGSDSSSTTLSPRSSTSTSSRTSMSLRSSPEDVYPPKPFISTTKFPKSSSTGTLGLCIARPSPVSYSGSSTPSSVSLQSIIGNIIPRNTSSTNTSSPISTGGIPMSTSSINTSTKSSISPGGIPMSSSSMNTSTRSSSLSPGGGATTSTSTRRSSLSPGSGITTSTSTRSSSMSPTGPIVPSSLNLASGYPDLLSSPNTVRNSFKQSGMMVKFLDAPIPKSSSTGTIPATLGTNSRSPKGALSYSAIPRIPEISKPKSPDSPSSSLAASISYEIQTGSSSMNTSTKSSTQSVESSFSSMNLSPSTVSSTGAVIMQSSSSIDASPRSTPSSIPDRPNSVDVLDQRSSFSPEPPTTYSRPTSH